MWGFFSNTKAFSVEISADFIHWRRVMANVLIENEDQLKCKSDQMWTYSLPHPESGVRFLKVVINEIWGTAACFAYFKPLWANTSKNP